MKNARIVWWWAFLSKRIGSFFIAARDTALLSSVLEEESSEIKQEKYDQHMAALRTQLQALDAALGRNTSYQQTIEQAIRSAGQALLCTKADNAHTSVRARGAVSDRGAQAQPLSFGQLLHTIDDALPTPAQTLKPIKTKLARVLRRRVWSREDIVNLEIRSPQPLPPDENRRNQAKEHRMLLCIAHVSK